MNWKKHVHKQNAKHFAWPAGWDTSEVIAEQLECSPERVREHLAPSIRSGEIEVKSFTIWDSETERKIVKVGFRISTGKRSHSISEESTDSKKESPSSSAMRERWPFYEGAKIMRPDNPSRTGIVKGKMIHWCDGKVATANSASQRLKLRLAKK
jgi:hypothetical protein